ncbi:MAG: hypothetical protein JJU42_03355 [Rhodobacteraceae bacterium]|nr:hypothetical protein [Paracoccaceae bacterium]
MKVITDLSVTSAPHRARHGWHPDWLFLTGEQGAWFDPSDLSTLFQDSAGTLPATADGDPVGRMLDKSGNGRHLFQDISAARPVLRISGGLTWLEFDGVDDRMVFAEMPNTGTTTAILGLWRTSGSATASVLGTGGSGYLRNSNGTLVKNDGGNNPQVDTPGPFPITAPSAFAVRMEDGFIEARRATGGWFSASVAGNARTDFELLGAFSQGTGALPLPMRFHGGILREGLLNESDISGGLQFLDARMTS